MRVDLPHLKMFQDSILFDQNSQVQMQQGLSPYILTGFNIATPWSAGNPSNSLQVIVSGSIVTLAQDPNGSFLLVPTGTPNEVLASSNTNVTGSFTPSATNYVSVQFQRPADPSTDDLVAFWDEDAGSEFTQTVPLGLVLNYQFVVNTTGFANNAPICTVQTDAFNNVASITNCKSGLYRLGTGGSTPNPFNSWSYATSPENPLTATSSAMDPFANNGDWELATMKNWMDAVMTAIKQLKNTAYWYANGSTLVPGINLPDLFFDTDASVLTMRGKFIHSQVTPGMLTWTGTLNIRGIIGPLTYTIAPGNVTLADTQVAYVELVREQDFQPANTFTFANGNTVVYATVPVTGISSGDWIIFAADGLDDWAQVDTVSGSTVTLYEPYNGSTAVGKALRAQGSYTMQVADPLGVPVGGNSFWIAKRDDNGSITATVAAAPTGAVRSGGITTFSTTAPHGINAGQGIQVSGVAANPALFTGIVQGTSTSVTLTAVTPGAVGNSIVLTFTGSNSISSAVTTWNTANPSNQVALTSGDGTQVPSAGSVQLSGGNTSFNGFFEVLSVPTTSTLTVQNTGPDETSGGGTINSTATVYLRGIGEVSQGESSSDDSSALEALLEYTGSAYAGDTQPQYPSSNIVTQGVDLTTAIGELDAAISYPVYDERVLYPSGLAPSTSITLPNNSRNGGNQQFYNASAGLLEVYVNQLFKFQNADWVSVDDNHISFTYALPNNAEVHFRISSTGGSNAGGSSTLQEAYSGGNSITTAASVPFTVTSGGGKAAQFNGDIGVTGVIDPAGLELDPQSSNPLAATKAGIWTNSTGQLMSTDGTTPINITQAVENFNAGSVTGVNGATGAVQILPGTNVSITNVPGANGTVTINAAGGGSTTYFTMNLSNSSGSTIPANTPVYMSASGQISPGSCTNVVPAASRIVGVTTASIPNSTSGPVAYSGYVTGVATGLTQGAYAYLSATGTLTNTPPSTPGYQTVIVGIVNGNDLFMQITNVGTD